MCYGVRDECHGGNECLYLSAVVMFPFGDCNYGLLPIYDDQVDANRGFTANSFNVKCRRHVEVNGLRHRVCFDDALSDRCPANPRNSLVSIRQEPERIHATHGALSGHSRIGTMSTAFGLQNAACGRTASWPDNNAHPELRTLRGRTLRHLQLWILYGLWVVGMGFFIAMWILTFLCVARWVWTTIVNADATPLPYVVKLFLGGVAMHENYYYLTRPSLHRWPFMRGVMRYMFLHYPYFRLNVTVFEVREEAQQKLREAGKGLLDETTSATKTTEENDTTPFVKPNDRSMFAFHPHGVLSNGFAINGAHHMTFERAECRWLVAENLFWFPVLREVLNWMDFSTVAKATFQRIMPTGQNVSLIPGGFEEATLYRRGKHRVYINKRFGFIKMVLQYGYKVHPVYTFGEEYAYHAFPSLLKLRLKLNEFKLPGVVFFGRLNCCYLPRTDVDLITVVGKPLVLPHIENPTREDVKKYHDQYIEALQNLFDRTKVCTPLIRRPNWKSTKQHIVLNLRYVVAIWSRCRAGSYILVRWCERCCHLREFCLARAALLVCRRPTPLLTYTKV